MSGGNDSSEQACEFYIKAGNCYKVAQKWDKAGNAFCSSAKLKSTGEHKHEAATNYVDAALCYLKIDYEQAIECYRMAVEIYVDMGRFSIAAKHLTTAAEIYETKVMDQEKALQMYTQAGDFYKGEESTSAANKCYLKVAHIAAKLDQFEKAIALFAEIGAKCVDNALLKYGAKDHFFKAVLCALAIDHIRAQQCVEKYGEIHPAFKDSREYKLCLSLISDVQNENTDEFTHHVKEFDKISRMDEWLTSLLLKIKRTLPPPTATGQNSHSGAGDGFSESSGGLGNSNVPPASNVDYDEDDLS